MADKKDYSAILKQRKSCFNYLKDYENVIEVGDKLGLLIVYESEGKVIGSARLDSHGTSGIITRVVTANDYRKNGVGSSLVKYLIEYAKNNGIEIITLRCLSENFEFYHKLGFVKDGKQYVERNLDYQNMKMETI